MQNIRSLLKLAAPLALVLACSSEDTTTTNPHPLLAPLCDPSACANTPVPGAPNYQCADGAIAGPACVERAPNECAWEVLDCSDPGACTNEECGETPAGVPNWQCADGSVAGVACVRTNGACTWEIVECGDEGHDDGSCGGNVPPDDPTQPDCQCEDPAPAMPTYLCGNGQDIAGPVCMATATGTCEWVIRDCP